MVATNEDSCRSLVLTLAEGRPFTVQCESDLLEAMVGLSGLRSGQEAKLGRGAKHYIKAVRHNDLWAVSTRSGGYRTLASFTAALSTDYSDREVKQSRAAGSIWKRIVRSIFSPSPERSLSTAQVQTLFTEFFFGKRFSVPQSGA